MVLLEKTGGGKKKRKERGKGTSSLATNNKNSRSRPIEDRRLKTHQGKEKGASQSKSERGVGKWHGKNGRSEGALNHEEMHKLESTRCYISKGGRKFRHPEKDTSIVKGKGKKERFTKFKRTERERESQNVQNLGSKGLYYQRKAKTGG